ncbi:sensor histidine kinase [Arthrobacter monumenti]
MDKVLDFLTLNRIKFHNLSLRGRVVMSQLPLSATMLVLFIGTVIFHVPLLADPLFQLSLVTGVVLLLACFAVPWEKLPYPSFLIIPLLDFIPIGLMREGAGDVLTGLGMLAVFPVIWMAASGLLPRLSVLAGAVATLLMVWTPIFVRGNAINLAALTEPILIPFMMLAIGITVQVMTASMLEQQRVVESKDAELRGLLEASGRRERLLKTIVDTVDVGVLAIDENGNDVLMNRRQQEVHRIGLPDDLTDAAEADLLLFADGGSSPLPVEDRPAIRAIRGETFSDYLIWIGELPQQRVLSTSAQSMSDSDGRREGSVLAFNDVTDLVSALNAKDDFLSNVSHELRTPLTSIHGFTELLAMTEDLPPNVIAGLDVIRRNSDQLLKIVNDLLNTATGYAELQPTTADLAELIHQAVAAAEPRAAVANIQILTNTPVQLEVECDPGRIRQVLDNLLSNAIKYSHSGATVQVHGSAQNGTVQCQVADNGMGMNAEDSQDVFARFFRSSAARRSAIPGIGLGLALSKDIIERHGGTLTCTSTLGEGSAFTFTLPNNS